MIRVAIFDDNRHLRETFAMLLNYTEGFSCTGTYADCSQLPENLEQQPCDIVLMDIEMPGMNGIEATRIVKQHFPEIMVLIQTVFSEDAYIFDAICAGASGYILKNTTPSGYLEAIRDVQSGGSPMTPGIARRVLELFRNHVPANPPGEDFQLTTKEKQVLQLLVTGKSYKMIAAELFVATDTIKTHMKNIYAKLHVNSGTEAVAKALQHKLV